MRTSEYSSTPVARNSWGKSLLGTNGANESVCSIQFNIVSKKLGCERMSFFLNEAASDVRDMLMPGMVEKAKL